ncbi:hypothetical protein B9Z35_07260 [Limnohabitans sp. Jir61]|uniref:hypothetical protein n=1 Tax=Limnohabitans sp. Jir61 TaxID=1826168 RepID=UPI000D3C5335|nr:hypothetical protein [Limnohabitans sp. Jir61]PUE30842.1 hypothetical protein B9Z35_07260 [Limnohabitans sp. Jir61]
MLFFTSAPLMSSSLAPDTEPLAKPTSWQTVSNATVLKILKGTYRNAVFDGVFLVDEVETAKHKDSKDGWSVAIVYCLWFGTRLKTRGIELKYQADGSELIANYTGEVVSNLST